MHSVSIIGCGYTGTRLAARWRRQGHAVRGFCARSESLRGIEAAGAEPALLNLDRPVSQPVDLHDDVAYYTVPPAPAGDGDERLERLFSNLAGLPSSFVYLSTTGVYGDRHGATVDEQTPPRPTTARAVRRLAAERIVREWADSQSVSWCILRVPGIYGPERLPLERLRRGDPAIDPVEATPSNRIHVEDLVTACVAAAAPHAGGRIYNVTDGTDDSLTAYLQRVARIAGLPPPPLIGRAEAQKTSSPMAWSFLSESRRVDNRRMREELGMQLAYADLDAGIRASL
jgi:nucleoside-diphosphate-sugar epimerase